MSRFSPSDVALEGFRLTRERPLAVLAWAVVRLLFSVFSLLLLFGAGGTAFSRLMTLENSGAKARPEDVMPLMAQLWPSFSVLFVLSLIFYAVLYTAVLRAILRPADKAFFYLRVSMEEARQFGLAVIIFFLFLAYVFVISIVSSVLIQLASSMGQAGTLVDIILIIAVLSAFVYPVVRLSLAPAMTFADGRISLFRSAPVTRGQFWSIFGTYVLAVVLAVVVFALGAVIFTLLLGAIGMAQGNGLSALPALLGSMRPDEMTLKTFMAPLRLLNTAFGAILMTLAYLIVFAPAAAIFRDLTGRVGAPAPAAVAKPGQPWG
jgi:hypothetical protein